jgi:hypothetical protein
MNELILKALGGGQFLGRFHAQHELLEAQLAAIDLRLIEVELFHPTVEGVAPVFLSGW